MRILQIARGHSDVLVPAGGAIETLILNLSAQHSRMGHRVTIVDNAYSPGKPPVGNYEGAELVRLGMSRFRLHGGQKLPILLQFIRDEFNTLLFALKVSRYLKRSGSDFDVISVHLTLIGAVLVILNRDCRHKLLYTNHTSVWSLAENRLGIIHKITMFMDAFLMRLAGRTIVPNDSLKERLVLEKINPQAIIIMPNTGIEFDVPDLTGTIRTTEKKFGTENLVTILFVGRLVEIKGVEYLVKAINILVNEFHVTELKLLVVGPATSPNSIDKTVSMKDLLSYIETNGLQRQITFVGAVYDGLDEIYAACDMLVVPSLAELLGRIILEAMVFAKPVIGTRVGGIPALIKDEWNGLLVDPANERQLAEKIRHLVENPQERIRMGANGREFVEREFGWQTVATKYSSIYQDLMGIGAGESIRRKRET